MAQEQTPVSGVSLDPDSGVPHTTVSGVNTYDVQVDNGQIFKLDIDIAPDKILEVLRNQTHPAHTALLHNLRQYQVGVEAPKGVITETLLPSLQVGAGPHFLGALTELSNMALRAGVDLPINAAKWLSGGAKGPFPGERYITHERPIGGGDWFRERFREVSGAARTGREFLEEHVPELTVDLPGLAPRQMGVGDVMRLLEFDMDPDESDKAREYISLIGQIAGSAALEGAGLIKLVEILAKSGGNPTTQRVHQVLNEFQSQFPKLSVTMETSTGALAGGGTIASMELLNKYWPDAPPAIQSLLAAGGALTIPTGVVGGVSFLNRVVPVASIPGRILSGALETIHPEGIQRATSRAIQTKGDDWRNRNNILGVIDHLKLAYDAGRSKDVDFQIAYTMPQFARNEANILRVQLNAAREGMPTDQIATAEKFIEDLNIYADVQESILLDIYKDPKLANEVYVRYSERMLGRTKKLFDSIESAVFKTDVGGDPSEGIAASVIAQDWDQGVGAGFYRFRENRVRARREGRAGAVSHETVAPTKQAFESITTIFDDVVDEALLDAQEQVALIRKNIPPEASAEVVSNYNETIRRVLEESYLHIDALEDVMWNSVKNFEKPKTKLVQDRDGNEIGPEILIDGVPIGEYFANRVADVAKEAGASEHQSKYLWQLAGGTELRKAAETEPTDSARLAKAQSNIRAREELIEVREGKLQRARDSLNDIKRQLSNAERRVDNPKNRKAVETLRKKLDAALQKENTILDDIAGLEIRRDEAERAIDITFGGNPTFQGDKVNLVDEILDSGMLGVRTVGEELVGRSPKDVFNVISLLKQEARVEGGKQAGRDPAKLKAIGSIVDDLKRALSDPENFELDQAHIDTANVLTAIKKDSFEKGPVGQIRGYKPTGESRVELEGIEVALLPLGTAARTLDPAKQQIALREIQTALTKVETGEGTAFKINDEGKPELDPTFDLTAFSDAPPPPFISVKPGTRRSYGFDVAEGTLPSAENIEIVRGILWKRFRSFGDGETFNSVGAEKFINDNAPAIEWLRKATKEDTGFEDLRKAQTVVEGLERINSSNIDSVINGLRRRGVFNEVFTEEALRGTLNDAKDRSANLIAASAFLEVAPQEVGGAFLQRYFSRDTTKDASKTLADTLQILESGRLEDGTNPALDGFKLGITEAIFKRSLTGADESPDVKRLADSLKRQDVTILDANKMLGLLKDPRTEILLYEVFGEHAPALMKKFSQGIADQQTLISSAAQPGVALARAASTEMAGNLGRVIGLYALAKPGIINALVAAGIGRRAAVGLATNLRGQGIQRLVAEALMDPDFAMMLMEKYPTLTDAQKGKWYKRVTKVVAEELLDKNVQRLREKVEDTPGAVYEIGDPDPIVEEEAEKQSLRIPEDASIGPPTMASRMPPPRPRVSGSSLDRVDPLQFAGASTSGPPSPDRNQIVQGMDTLGLDLFTARDGGLASIKKKKKSRQMVY